MTVTNISAVISWEVPAGFIDSYTIQYRLANDVLEWDGASVVTVTNTTTTLTLTRLTPSTTYLARVITNNQNGASEPSPVIQFSTQCEYISFLLSILHAIYIIFVLTAPSPPIIDGPTSEFAGMPVSLICSSPLVDTVVWSRTNAPLPAGHVLSNSGTILTIPDPVVGDTGVYICTVGNTMQNHSLVIEVLVPITSKYSTAQLSM